MRSGPLPSTTPPAQVVTGGIPLTHLFDYAEASTADATGGTKASWSSRSRSAGTPTGNFPTSAAFGGDHLPERDRAGAAEHLDQPGRHAGGYRRQPGQLHRERDPADCGGYANVYQIRLLTTGAGGVGTRAGGTYWDDDILVNPSAGTWTEVYPAVRDRDHHHARPRARARPTRADGHPDRDRDAGDGWLGGLQERRHRPWILRVNGSGVATTPTSFAAAGTREPDGDVHAHRHR